MVDFEAKKWQGGNSAALLGYADRMWMGRQERAGGRLPHQMGAPCRGQCGVYMIEKMRCSLSDLMFRGDNSALTSMDSYTGEAILEHRGGHPCGELAEFAFNRTGGSRTEFSMSTTHGSTILSISQRKFLTPSYSSWR